MPFSPKHRKVRYFIICLALYVAGVGGYAVWENNRLEKKVLDNIDRQLLVAAKALKYMMAPDFHDRAVDAESISFEEEMANREAFNKFTSETGFQWLYTLAEKDGRFYFSAPTVSDEEARQQKRWYWLPYDDIPDAFVDAYRENKTVFVSYSDQWGRFRSTATPQTSPGGRRYLACADYNIGYIDAILNDNYRTTISTAAFFLALTMPFVLLFASINSELQSTNKELIDHRNTLARKVDERTFELKMAKDKAEALVVELEAALKKVKTLSGLLPICSNCKKIRDDKGYWNQIDAYIQEHSDAEFTHGYCPACAAEVYAELEKLKKE